MKTKSKLVLGLSLLSALTLAAGVSGTFAWYQATATSIGTQSSGLAVSQAAISGVTSKVNIAVTAPNSDAATLFLTTPVAVANADDTIELSAGEGAYYNGDADKAHMKKVTADSEHRAAINILFTVTPVDGFTATNGTYYVHCSNTNAKARLGTSVSGSGYASYVGNANLTLDIAITVAAGTFSSTTGYGVLSVTGATGTADSALAIATSDWSFTVDSIHGANDAAGSVVITGR